MSEVRTWAAYDQAVGLPDPWLQTGTLASLLHNQWAKTPLPPSHFMPGRDRPPAPDPSDPIGISNLFGIVPGLREHIEKLKVKKDG